MVLLGSFVLGLAGCFAPDPVFHLNATHLLKWEREYKEAFTAKRRSELGAITRILFGTPDYPRIPRLAHADVPAVLNEERLEMASGPVASDQTGRPTGLYRKHCAHCHGVDGGGIGPTARFLDPYPRDFRRGIYKFKSTPKGQKPTHGDLKRVLIMGLSGTPMPSYAALPDEELESLVHYVKYLSIRGEVERELIDYAATELETDEPLIDMNTWQKERQEQVTLVLSLAAKVIERWERAESYVVKIPGPDPNRHRVASIKRGRELLLGNGAGCVKCHGETGKGDGQTNDFDDWTKEMEPASADAMVAYRNVGALPPRNIRPRNFRLGIFRGSSEPEDLYRRVLHGIDGTPMPAALMASPDATSQAMGLTPDDVWCLVDYVRSLGSGNGAAE